MFIEKKIVEISSPLLQRRQVFQIAHSLYIQPAQGRQLLFSRRNEPLYGRYVTPLSDHCASHDGKVCEHLAIVDPIVYRPFELLTVSKHSQHQFYGHPCSLGGGLEDRLLRVEVGVERAVGHGRLAGDVGDPGLDEALALEDPTSRVDQGAFGLRTPARERAVLPTGLLGIGLRADGRSWKRRSPR